MTTEAFIPADDYTVAGVGPYTVPHEYGETSALVAEVLSGVTSHILVEGIDYTVTPETDAASGSLYLTAGMAVAHAGKALRITRRTVVEQGWASAGGAREKGLEVQLDRLTRGIQDLERADLWASLALRRTLRIPELLSSVSPLPALALRAGKVLAFDFQGNPTAHEPLVAVIVDDTFTIGTALTAYLVTVDPAVEVIRTQGYAARGDGGGAEYVRADAEPSHAGKLQTADGQWWTLAAMEPTPLMFGAKWDWDMVEWAGTDDTDAINACASFCRATKRTMRLPAGFAYAADTLWLGAVDIRGAGNARAGGAEWARRSSTALFLGGSWGFIKGEPGYAKSSTGHWENFEFVSALAVGATTSAKTLWYRVGFEYQIGGALGRNPLMMSSGTLIADGAGYGTIRNVSFRGFGGVALYGHFCWGLSVLENCTFHECGGPAAVAYGDREGGGVIFDNCGVDHRVRNLHLLNTGYGKESPYYYRGVALRLGSTKADTDALGRTFSGGGGVNISDIQSEGWAVPLDIRSTNDIKMDGLKLEGDDIYIGEIGNASDQGRVHMGRWSTYSVRRGSTTMHAANVGTVDFGTFQGFDRYQPLIVKNKGAVKMRRAGGMALRRNTTPRSLSAETAVIILPDWNASGSPSGSTAFIPWIDIDSPYRAAEAENLLPAIPDPIAAPYALTGSGTIKERVDARTFRIARGEAAEGEYAEVSADLTLLGGEVYSGAFRVEAYGATLDWRLLEFGVRGDFEYEIKRRIGDATANFGGVQTGTVSVENGASTVTGVGTTFSAMIVPGTRIKLGSSWCVVATVSREPTETDTVLTLASPFRGATLSGAAWEWEGEPRVTSRVFNFQAPPDGVIEIYVRSTGFNSAYIRDLTVVRGFLVDFPIQR